MKNKIQAQRKMIKHLRTEATWLIKSNKPVKQRLAIWHSKCERLDMYLAMAEQTDEN
ncbi:hypothetical protein HOI26_04290 [Candidatus Woesearchaeota archaeon]|jgi:hypothetical protein|nr:hypothetical protein [Candidatus Woesearchaeota archaeon]